MSFSKDLDPPPGAPPTIVAIQSDDDLTRIGAHERVHRFFAYWRSLHRDGQLPGRQHVDPLAIPDLLPGAWLLDVQREPFRLRYRLVGTRVVEAIGREVTGQWLDEAHPDIGRDPRYLARSRAVVETGTPSWRRGPPNLWRHEVYSMIENLIVPFAADGKTIDMLMTLTVFFTHDGTASG